MKQNTAYIAVAALLLALTACGSEESRNQDRVVKVGVQAVRGAGSGSQHEYVGTLEEASASNLSFGASGRVMSVRVKAGQQVRKGQLLATVDKAQAENSFRAAKATLDQAQDGYDRARLVHDRGSLPEVKWVEVQTQLGRAQSLYDIAQKNLDDCFLYAPADGTIDDIAVESGSSVTAFQPVMRLLNLKGMYAKMSVPEVDINQVNVGDSMWVEVSALGEAKEPLRGVVEERGVSADALSHSYMVRLRLLNPGKELLPGMVCRVRQTACAEAEGFEIPGRAVQLASDGSRYVWVADDSVARQRQVKIGDLSRSGVLVTDGLRDGDRVIVDGTLKVSEGTRITY